MLAHAEVSVPGPKKRDYSCWLKPSVWVFALRGICAVAHCGDGQPGVDDLSAIAGTRKPRALGTAVRPPKSVFGKECRRRT